MTRVREILRAAVCVERIPWLTLAVAAAAVAVPLAHAESFLVFDRARVAGGELWRLCTGNLVHFGWLHVFADVGLLVLLGRILEWEYRTFAVVSLVVIPVAVTGAVYLFDPRLATYGGLSGLNFGWLVFLALRGWRRSWTDWFWPAVLVLYIAEVIEEAWIGHGTIRFNDPTIVVATWAHLGGGAAAVLLSLVPWRDARRARAPTGASVRGGDMPRPCGSAR